MSLAGIATGALLLGRRRKRYTSTQQLGNSDGRQEAVPATATVEAAARSSQWFVGNPVSLQQHAHNATSPDDDDDNDGRPLSCGWRLLGKLEKVARPRLGFLRLFRDAEEASSTRRFGFSHLFHEPPPSQQASTIPSQASAGFVTPSDWAVRNGGHVPRPHRLKKTNRKKSKSRCNHPRDSWLLSSGIGSGSSGEVTSGMNRGDDGLTSDQTHTVRAKMAKISGPSGGCKAHVLSMIVGSEYGDGYCDGRCYQEYDNDSYPHSRHHQDNLVAISKTKLPDLRKSWLSSSDPHREEMGPQSNNKLSIDIQSIGSSQRARNRRSMSLPFIPSSQPPPFVTPPVPAPLWSSQLIIPKRANLLNASPSSKRSFASRTTVSSSILDGRLSPPSLLTTDLQQQRISASRIKRMESRRMIRRRSSAPSFFFLSDEPKHETIDDVLGRRPSGASSQLLPSPARPLVRINKTAAGVTTMKSRITPPAPQVVSQGFQLRTRDTPVSLIGLEADWDVFGYGDQMIDIKKKEVEDITRQTSRIARTENNANVYKDSKNSERPQPLQTPKPKKFLQKKKRTRQESCHLSFSSFAAIPYTSTVSLDTPLRIPVLGDHHHEASSVYSIPSSALPQEKSKDQNCSVSSLRSVVTSPFPLMSKQASSGMVLNTRVKDDLRGLSSPTPRQGGLFGPRQMSPTPLRLSLPDDMDSHQDSAQGLGPEISSGYKIVAADFGRRQSVISTQPQQQPIDDDGNTIQQYNSNYQSEELANKENEIFYPTAHGPITKCHHHSVSYQHKASSSLIDPPPIRLDPTPVQQSFYGYEAVAAAPSIVPAPNNKSSSCATNNLGRTQSTVLPPRPLSIRSVVAAPTRPPSRLSNNNFRTSVISQSISRQNSSTAAATAANNRRLSSRASVLLAANPESPIKTLEPSSRPITTDHHTSSSSICENDNHLVTTSSKSLSDSLEHEQQQRLSTSATPLKNYSELCNLFPKPLSSFRPPTWIFTEPNVSSSSSKLTNSATINNNVCSPPPHLSKAKLGLPPHPRYYLDQQQLQQQQQQKQRQRKRTSASSMPQPHQTTSQHSPARKSDNNAALQPPIQSSPGRTNNNSSSNGVLEPISINCYRSPSPSPPSIRANPSPQTLHVALRGASGGVPLLGCGGAPAPVLRCGSDASISAPVPVLNTQLKQRIKQAQQRKKLLSSSSQSSSSSLSSQQAAMQRRQKTAAQQSAAQQATTQQAATQRQSAAQQSATTQNVKGLGITLPTSSSSSYSSCFPWNCDFIPFNSFSLHGTGTGPGPGTGPNLSNGNLSECNSSTDTGTEPLVHHRRQISSTASGAVSSAISSATVDVDVDDSKKKERTKEEKEKTKKRKRPLLLLLREEEGEGEEEEETVAVQAVVEKRKVRFSTNESKSRNRDLAWKENVSPPIMTTSPIASPPGASPPVASPPVARPGACPVVWKEEGFVVIGGGGGSRLSASSPGRVWREEVF